MTTKDYWTVNGFLATIISLGLLVSCMSFCDRHTITFYVLSIPGYVIWLYSWFSIYKYGICEENNNQT